MPVYKSSCVIEGLRREVGAVGPHICNKAEVTHRAQIDAFVQLLGNAHGPFCGKAHAIGGGLLQGGSDKWRRRPGN